MADDNYLQLAGGSIGLELTGAVSRPFMLRWDVMYLDKVRKAGVCMEMYERYVDDSNQVAVVPPLGAKYDKAKKKVVIDRSVTDSDENDDERTAKVLTDIANDVLPGIIMEYVVPSRNEDRKMPRLDMNVWVDTCYNANYRCRYFWRV